MVAKRSSGGIVAVLGGGAVRADSDMSFWLDSQHSAGFALVARISMVVRSIDTLSLSEGV